jgi:hypothetical protein
VVGVCGIVGRPGVRGCAPVPEAVPVVPGPNSCCCCCPGCAPVLCTNDVGVGGTSDVAIGMDAGGERVEGGERLVEPPEIDTAGPIGGGCKLRFEGPPPLLLLGSGARCCCCAACWSMERRVGVGGTLPATRRSVPPVILGKRGSAIDIVEKDEAEGTVPRLIGATWRSA